MKKAIIFDLDGTLFNSLNVYKDAHKMMFSKRGLEYKILPHNKGSKTIELMETFADYFKNETGENILAENLLKEQDEIVFNEYEEKVQMTKGVREFLDFLNENNIRKAVATTARNKTIKILFDKYDLWKEFEVIVSGDDIEKSKPDPEIYEKVFEKLNSDLTPALSKGEGVNTKIEKIDCIAIEDSRVGVESAKNAGIEVVCIPNVEAFNKDKDLSIADYIFESFESGELREVVLK